jgi:hypothetical protein
MRIAVLFLLTGCVTLRESPVTTTPVNGNNNNVNVTINTKVKEVPVYIEKIIEKPVEKIVYKEPPVWTYSSSYYSSSRSWNLSCGGTCKKVIWLTSSLVLLGAGIVTDQYFKYKNEQITQAQYNINDTKNFQTYTESKDDPTGRFNVIHTEVRVPMRCIELGDKYTMDAVCRKLYDTKELNVIARNAGQITIALSSISLASSLITFAF